ncbi:Enzymatic polyprotein [Artemisia annua]|uniref:Enzymatic polyprotein n=1 Tax=Artemisia annua TaxID=35608 RepID=A0A2U1MLE8_ARTAN|nr:Enzymatic polyprotein [Artemisia annua]
MIHVKRVLERVKEVGIILSASKSKILKTEIEYLGLEIGKHGVLKLAPHTQEKIMLFPDKLEDRKQIQRFLGCINYIADQGFSKNFAKHRSLLQKKISEKTPWSWGEEDTNAVKLLKKNLTNLPELYNAKNSDFLIIETDASETTWAGCMLAIQNGKNILCLDEFGRIQRAKEEISIPEKEEISIPEKEDHSTSETKHTNHERDKSSYTVQKDKNLSYTDHKCDNNQMLFKETQKLPKKLCKYTSGTFKPAEINYTVHEKEVLAIIRTLNKWKMELLPTRFELRTDSKYATGVYTNWGTVSQIVTGRPYTHRSYPTREEAEKALEEAYKEITMTKRKPESANQISRMMSLERETSFKSRKLNYTDFTACWKRLVEFKEDDFINQYYPRKRQNLGPKAVLLPGINLRQAWELVSLGFADTIYINGKTLEEAKVFPEKLQDAISVYKNFIAKGNEIFLKCYSSYAIFDEDGEMILSSITIAQLGISNGSYAESQSLQGTNFGGKEIYTEGIMGVFDHGRQLGKQGKGDYSKIKVNYMSPTLLVYSKTSKPMTEGDAEAIQKFEEKFHNLDGVFEKAPEELKETLCQRISKVCKSHLCMHCYPNASPVNSPTDSSPQGPEISTIFDE